MLVLLVLLVGALAKRNGINFLNGQWSANKYDSAGAATSFDSVLTQLSANSIALTFCWYQHDVDTPGPIYERNGTTPTDEQLGSIITKAQGRGIRVLMRPCVDPDWTNPDTKGTWRGMTGRHFTDAQWRQWFGYFNAMTLHYAAIAEQYKVDMFSVGLEYIVASNQTSYWKSLVSQVRGVYHGVVTYGANHGNEGNVQWWDQVDIIGVDAYYPLDILNFRPSVEDLVKAWKPITANLSALSRTWNRSIAFTEIGYCSQTGNNVDPASCNSGALNLTAQVVSFSAFFSAVYSQPWFEGVYLWAWTTAADGGGGPDDPGFCPASKPVASLIQKYFTS